MLASILMRAMGPAYILDRELAGGGMSRVFVVRDRELDRLLAVKMLAPDRLEIMSAERFKREILTVAALQHPNIVPVLSAGDAEGIPFFVMPYVEGGSIRALIGPPGMSVPDTVRILTDVVRALGYAHARGIIHRDIKPDNILVSGGSAVVTDFGVAKAISSALGTSGRAASATLTHTGVSFGTPMYMAPEQVAADPSVDHRADFYAFGVTAYEMLLGQPPFSGESPRALLASKMTKSPGRIRGQRPDVSGPFERLVFSCLEPDADRRPQEAGQLLRELSDPAVVSGGMPSIVSPSLERPLIPPFRKRPRLAAAMAGIIVALATAGWFLVGPGGTNGPATLDPRAIAVLPFVDVSAANGSANFADALSQSVRNGLTRSGKFRVAAGGLTGSALARGADVRSVGRQLGTRYVVEGTLEREGNVLRLSVQLISAADGLSRWANTYDGEVAHRLDLENRAVTDLVGSVTDAILSDTINASKAPAARRGQ
ncbi:MAG TPA: serine/threonine-protein kinase [Gemmatimonadaceae bacterium]|nr:serine/threonine-protein kinase [Gemmatimonadaceae bacterium]